MSLDELEEQVERIYVDMENELLLNIAKKLSAGKPMEIDKWDETTGQPIYGSGGVNEWQLERLKELNGLNNQNAKIIAKYSGKTLKEVEKVFAKAQEIGTETNKSILETGIKAGILNEINPRTEEEQVSGILSSAVQEVLTTFNKQNNSLLASAGSEYMDIINKVSTQVLAGTKTVEKAMQEAVSKLAEKGLTGFTAKNGARWSPEAYTKMVIRSNTQNTINHIQDEQMALAGNDYIEISQHSGARPKCADDQGQIYSLSGNTEPIVDGRGKKIKVRSWSSSSYGQPDGILGINCGHSRRSFVPGLSIHRDELIPKGENSKDYKEKQRQRQYERTIRNKKREIAMLKQTKAEDSYIRMKQNSLSNTRKEYLDFLDKTGRTRITANEWIGSTTLSPKVKEKSVNSYQNWQKKDDKRKQQEELVKKSIVGKFDISKYTNNIKTSTKDVVFFEERKKHVKERHPEVEKYIKNIPNIIKKPDLILQETKRDSTIWLVKTFDKNVKVTMKLNTTNNRNLKNSIIQMQFMRDSEINRNIRNGKVTKLFDKNDKK